MPITSEFTPRKVKFAGCVLLGAAVALSGCASGPRIIGGASDVTVADGNILPLPRQVAFLREPEANLLGPRDLLKVTVAGVDWLTDQEIRLDLNGEISFPLAGPIEAAGLSPRELETVLRGRLISNGKMVSPKVSVNVLEVVSKTVTVEGEVGLPGIYPVTQRLSLLQTVAMAQGTRELAKLDDVVVFRTVDGQRYAALYNLDDIRHGAYSDPRIFPDDIVMVGDERGRRIFKDILAIAPLITSPLVIAIDRLTN